MDRDAEVSGVPVEFGTATGLADVSGFDVASKVGTDTTWVVADREAEPFDDIGSSSGTTAGTM